MAQVFDANGVAVTSLSSADQVLAAGVVHNPCTEDFILTTNSSCLIVQLLLNGNSSAPNTFELVTPFCSQAITEWVIPGGGQIQEIMDLGQRPVDYYMLEITFGDPGVHFDTSYFEITQ